MLGRSARTLGVRVDGPHADVALDALGRVVPGQGGMSATVDEAARMPPARRPKWLGHGLSEDPLFRSTSAELGEGLTVRIDRGARALVEPVRLRPLEEFEELLAASRERWLRITPPQEVP